jgi:hypothetical protein
MRTIKFVLGIEVSSRTMMRTSASNDSPQVSFKIGVKNGY